MKTKKGTEIQNIKSLNRCYSLEYYRGSLDFPCDFCNSNSYTNFHIHVNSELIVVCEDCLMKSKLNVKKQK